MTKEFNNSMQLVCPEELTKSRFVPKSGLSREDAKKICEANDCIWECD